MSVNENQDQLTDLDWDKLIPDLKTKGKFITMEDVTKSINESIKKYAENNNNAGDSGKYSIPEFLTHLASCNNDNCSVHKAKVEHNTQLWLRGFVNGAKIGELVGKRK